MALQILSTLLILFAITIDKLNGGLNEDIAYEAEILTTFLDNGHVTSCQATIISQNYVITAASCFTDISPSIFYTESDYDFKLIWRGEEYLIDQLIRHNKYVRRTKANNLAVVKINHQFPITGDDIVKGIRNFNISNVDADDINIIGFMTKKSPRDEERGCSVSGTILSSTDCIRKVTTVDSTKLEYLDSPNICFVPNDIRGCDFSKGAALIGDYIIFGVLSDGPTSCLQGDNCMPFIFTPLINYTDWIDSKIHT